MIVSNTARKARRRAVLEEHADEPKVCRCCGREHDSRAWAELPLRGEMDDGAGGRLELRNCPCGSTLAVVIASEVPQ